jgi:molecular chaperone HtpG
MSKREFQTEVNQLLHLIVHSLYSHPEIFLRELISNASDALDKLRHLTLVDDAYKGVAFTPRIDLELNEENKSLSIADTGIGMNEEELISNLGRLPAREPKLPLPPRREEGLQSIGQSGWVYSAFMVADRRGSFHAKQAERWRWGERWPDGDSRSNQPNVSFPARRCWSTSTKKASSTPTLAVAGSRQEVPNHIAFHLPHLRQEWSGTRRRRNRSNPHHRTGSTQPAPRGRPKSELERRGLQGTLQIHRRG